MKDCVREMRLGLVVACIVLMACASPVRTHFDRDTSADFANFRTFAWVGPPPLARAKEGSGKAHFISALDDQRIRNAVNATLESRGYRLVSSVEKADLVVAYSIGSEEKVRVYNSPMNATIYPYPARYRYGAWYGASNVSVHQYTEGTLTLEFFDRRTEQAVWVGWASRRFTRRDDTQALVSEAVSKILSDFPKRSAG